MTAPFARAWLNPVYDDLRGMTDAEYARRMIEDKAFRQQMHERLEKEFMVIVDILCEGDPGRAAQAEATCDLERIAHAWVTWCATREGIGYRDDID